MTEPDNSTEQQPGAASSEPTSPTSVENSIPKATIRTVDQVAARRLRTRLWWLTALCAVLAIALVASSFLNRGTLITIEFDEGHGLKVGDTLRYRGIDIGAVSSLKLAEDFSGVEVGVVLERGHEQIAVEGSQFWIERARLRIGQIAGLDTVLGAKYLSVIPGDQSGPRQSNFTGVEIPLGMATSDSLDIRIRFPAGEGLQVGDTVQYRGISVGEVTFVDLSEDTQAVDVGVRLVGSARKYARAGTQFWIERPRLDLTEIRGLETLLGGRYIALQTTNATSAKQIEFTGLPEAPPMPRSDGSLEIELDAPRRMGLVRGAPITYRGLEVGRIANVGLSKDGASVKITGVVDGNYAELLRENSKWWAVGGFEFDAGLSGISLSVESLSAWMRGGVAFATPPSPGARIMTGHRFMLEPEPLPDWLQWQPRIAVGINGQSATGLPLPSAVRVVASWQASWLGLYRRKTAETWALALDDGSLRVPLSFVQAAEDAGTEVTIEVAGASFPFESENVERSGNSARIPIRDDIAIERWSPEQLQSLQSIPMTMLVINPELSEFLAIDQTRVTRLGEQLKLAPGVALVPQLSGSPVIDAQSGKVIGILVSSQDGWFISGLKR